MSCVQLQSGCRRLKLLEDNGDLELTLQAIAIPGGVFCCLFPSMIEYFNVP